MVATLNAALARLDTGTYLKIPEPAGRTLAVLNGLVWVTQDGDPRDAFIASGETFEFDRPGLAIVEAMSETRLAVYAAEGVTEQSALV